jgi:Cu-Zn family superoxide dismutase
MIDQTIQQMYQAMLKTPVACAHITGSSELPNLTGDVYAYPFLQGSLVAVDIEGIPFSGFYGFHVHQHGPCIAGEGYTGFHDVGSHFSKVPNQPHPYHAGDLPVLMSYYGHAFMIVYTDRFVPEEILGRAMIIHEWPDDFRSQPTGDSGQPIGCGTFYPCCPDQQGILPGTQPMIQPGGEPQSPSGENPVQNPEILPPNPRIEAPATIPAASKIGKTITRTV